MSEAPLPRCVYPHASQSHFGTMASESQLTPFEIGQIKAHAYHGLGPLAISRLVRKPDGKHFSDTAIANAIAKLGEDPTWRGERKAGSGRKRKTSIKLDRDIVKEVFRSRGKFKVTVAFLQRKFPAARRVSADCLESRLHEAGLAYLRRRRKTLVPVVHIGARMAFAASVLRRHQSTLDRWAYSDGTVFYLDRTQAEMESKKRKALGPFVWRKADRSDALYHECTGPSSYAKAQGIPVRVWGLLANGALHIAILPEKVVMNRWVYRRIIRTLFPKWLDGCTYLIQDYERCLRCDEPRAAMKEISLTLVEEFPKCSQDLNAIENCWAVLRERLFATMPSDGTLERRDAFIRRLRAAVQWMNRNRREQLLKFCQNQKERAREVIDLKGSRTSW